MRFVVILFSLTIFSFVFCVSPLFGQTREATDVMPPPKLDKSAAKDAVFFDAMRAKMHDDDKQAKELFENFVALKPDAAAAYFELARIYEAERRMDKAEENIKKAISLDSKNKWFKRQYATILGEKGAFEDAANVIGELVEQEPRDEEFPLLAAEYYEHAKKYSKAIIYLDKALLSNGLDEDILMRKVRLYLALNDVDNASNVINALIAKDPKNGKYYKALGEIFDNNNEVKKATELYERGNKLIPDDPSLQIGLAEHYLKLGDTNSYYQYVKKAITNKEFEPDLQIKLLDAFLQNLPSDSSAKREGMPIILKLLEQHPNDGDILAFYAEFLESDNKHDSAAEIYKKALEMSPSKFNIWLKLLQNYSGKKDADSLVKYSEKAVRLFPNQALSHYYNGVGHLNKREYSPAIKSLNRAIDMQPDDRPELLAAMYSTLGDVYYFTKQYELSDNAFDKSLKYDPKDASVLNNYAYYLSERGARLEYAEKMSKKSLELRPGEATFLDTYGWIQYKLGKYDVAREYIEKAILNVGSRVDGVLYDHLGNIFFKLNNKEKAIENWKIAKEKGDEDILLDKKLRDGKLYE